MLYLGIDLGGTNIKAAVVDGEGVIIKKGSHKTDAKRGSLYVIKDMGQLCVRLLEEAGIALDGISAVGVGAPGTIDSDNGVVYYSNNLEWRNVPLADELRKIIDKPVYISNDANVAALGEAMFGASKGCTDSIFVTLGTGVGGGVILGGKLFEGNKSAGAELGHVKLGDAKRQCTCGRYDCWETYSSATALIRDTKEAMRRNKNSAMWELAGELDKVDGRTAFTCAKHGDSAAQAVVNEYLYYLGEALINLANVFRPQKILIGGGISGEGEYIIKPLQKSMDECIYGGQQAASVRVELASLKNDAGILGAAALAVSHSTVKEQK
ncbi:MAG: ROK family protein [Clostridiales bacterium]|jgi:glucokinase|nr:ROK family protein [Clostridiales bacterium]